MSASLPFRLAVISDEVSQEPRRIAALAQEHRLAAVEIRSLWERPPHQLSAGQVRDARSTFADAGLAVCGIASPFLKCDYGDEAQFEQHLEILRKSAERADQFATSFIRGFTFWRHAPLVNRFEPILEKFQEVTRILESTSKTLLIENESSTNTATGAETACFLSQLAHPQVKAIWDPANCIFSPVPESPFPEGYERIKDWMLHIHVKDARKGVDGEPECVPVGEGQVGWLGQLKALRADGYQGYLSLETHWRAKALSKEELERPGGEKFSEGGEEASHICLNNLRSLLEQI